MLGNMLNDLAKAIRRWTEKNREVGSLPSLRNKMHDDILCVILSMATENEAKQRHTEQHKVAMQEG